MVPATLMMSKYFIMNQVRAASNVKVAEILLKEVEKHIDKAQLDMAWFQPGGGWNADNRIDEWRQIEPDFEFPNSPSPCNSSFEEVKETQSLSQEQGDQLSELESFKQFKSFMSDF